MQLEKKFNTNFSVKKWAILYFLAMALNLAFNIGSKPLLTMLGHNSVIMIVVSYVLSITQMLILLFFSSIVYAKAILFFINTLSLDDNKFAIKTEESSFVAFVLSNIVICIVTLGIYIPWAYKAIVDKIVTNTEYASNGRFSFRSKASTLFCFNIVCFLIALFILGSIIGVFAFIIAGMKNGRGSSSFLFLLKNIGILFLISLFALIIVFFLVLLLFVVMRTFMLKWLGNLTYTSENKNRIYVMDINMKDAVFFTLGQTLLLCITIGFYSGAYMLNIYTYFSEHIVEKDGDKNTGALGFKKPADKGAGYLLLQVILSIITVGFYTPFAWVSYARFFVNNTYLITEEDEAKDSGTGSTILIGSNADSAKEEEEHKESVPNGASTEEQNNF